MEFRIAPYIMLSLGIIIALVTMPEWNDSAMLIEKGQKYLIIEGIIWIMSLSAYLRHDYYTPRERRAFWILLSIFSLLLIKFLFQYLNF